MDKDTTIIYTTTLLSEGLAVGKIFYLPGAESKTSIAPSDLYDFFATTPIQTHSLNVKVVDSEYEWDLKDKDALVTFEEDVAIGVRTADCVPVLMYAEDVNGAAAVHAGWKGTLGGIVDNTLDVLEEHGADLSKLRVTFGPSISKEHYEVDRELADKFIAVGFEKYVSYPDGAEGKPHLDLQGINIERLLRRGVPKENITPSDICTFSSKGSDGEYMYPSYRRDGTSDRFMTSIMLLNKERLEAERRRLVRRIEKD